MTREEAASLLATLAVDPPGSPDHDIEVARLLAGSPTSTVTLRYARKAARTVYYDASELRVVIDEAARVLGIES